MELDEKKQLRTDGVFCGPPTVICFYDWRQTTGEKRRPATSVLDWSGLKVKEMGDSKVIASINLNFTLYLFIYIIFCCIWKR